MIERGFKSRVGYNGTHTVVIEVQIFNRWHFELKIFDVKYLLL